MASDPSYKSLSRTGFFGRTWGSSTSWRSGSCREPPGLYDNFCTDIGEIESKPQVTLPTRPASPLVRDQPNLNKPLPPLPKNEQFSKHPADPTSTNVTSKMSAVDAIGVPSTRSLKVAARRSRLAAKRTHVSFTGNPKSSKTMGPAIPETAIRPMMVDRGMQTIPSEHVMEPQRNAKPDVVRFTAHAHSVILKTISAEKNLPRTPLRLQSNSAADKSDYFCFSSEADDDEEPITRHWSGSDNVVPHQRQGMNSSRSPLSTETPSSVSTYGSRYDERPELIGQVTQRPPFRRSISDSTTRSSTRRPGMHQHSNSEHGSSASSGVKALLVNTEGTAKRLMLGPRQGTLPGGTASKRRSMGQSDSAASVVSPLRTEMILTPAAPSADTAREKEIFRASVGDFSPSLDSQRTAFLADIPDHLRSSPLCPLHPKNRSKDRGYCALHGAASLADESDEYSVPNKHHIVPVLGNVGVDAPGSTNEGDQFSLRMPVHSRDSPECPASSKHISEGKGLCIVHGRGRGRVREN